MHRIMPDKRRAANRPLTFFVPLAEDVPATPEPEPDAVADEAADVDTSESHSELRSSLLA